VYRYPKWVPVCVCAAFVATCVGIVDALVADLESFAVLGGLIGISVLLAIAMLHVHLACIALTHDSLEWVAAFRRRSIPRKELIAVSFAAGCPVAVQHVSGRWVTLPSLGAGNRLAMGIRWWIKPKSESADAVQDGQLPAQ
jgi:hypothetical protein